MDYPTGIGYVPQEEGLLRGSPLFVTGNYTGIRIGVIVFATKNPKAEHPRNNNVPIAIWTASGSSFLIIWFKIVSPTQYVIEITAVAIVHETKSSATARIIIARTSMFLPFLLRVRVCISVY